MPIIIIITLLPIHLQRMELRGAFHSTKISGNSGSKLNETESFRKFVSKILVHLSRLSFFLEIWKFQKIPVVTFGISTQNESARVHLFVKSYKMAASLSSQHCIGCKMICHRLSLFLIAYSPRKRKDLISWKIVDWSFPNFLWVISPGLHTLFLS